MRSTPSTVLRLLVLVTFLSLGAGIARAQTPADPGSVALRWDACYGDGGPDSKSFACNTNSGTEVLIVSAISQNAIPQVNSATISMAIVPSDGVLPNWWSFQSGQCRAASINSAFNPPSAHVQCFDLWQGTAVGGIATASPFPSAPGSVNYNIVCGLPQSVPAPGGQELFLARVLVSNSKTAGAGSCTGCLSGSCLGISKIWLGQPNTGNVVLVGEIPGTHSNTVGWQMSGGAMSGVLAHSNSYGYYTDFTACSSATDAQRPTWGQIKKLYR